MANITLNSEQEVIDATKKAFAAVREYRTRDALNHLGVLYGLKSGLPLRSAILWVLMPGYYPIIDRWAFKALYNTESFNDHPLIYEKYIKDVHSLSKKYDINDVHKTDVFLMQKGSGKISDDNPFEGSDLPIIDDWQAIWEQLKPFKYSIPDQNSASFKTYREMISIDYINTVGLFPELLK